MKYIACVIVICLSTLTGYAQSCFPSGIAFNSQADLETNMASNPNCRIIDGNLSLSQSVNDLTPLSNIEVIKGNLLISSSASALTGLESIDSIYGDLMIEQATGLTNSTAIENLLYLGGDLIISKNPDLEISPNFTQLTLFEGENIKVDSNLLMQTLPSLPNVDKLEGEFLITDSGISNLVGMEHWKCIGILTLERNPALEEIDLGTLESLDILKLKSLDSLQILDLSNLSSVNSEIVLQGLRTLEVLSLPSLDTLKGDFDIFACDFLHSIELDNLVRAKDLSFGGSDSLTSLYLPILESIEEGLHLFDFQAIELIDIPELQRVGGDLHFERMESLMELNMPSLDSVGDIRIHYIRSEMKAFKLDDLLYANSFRFTYSYMEEISFNSLYVKEKFHIYSNPSLQSVSFSGVTELEDNIGLSLNDSLTEVSFNNLTTMGGQINVGDNNMLETLRFPLLSSAHGLDVYNNDNLETLDFPSLTALYRFINFVDNNELINLGFSALNGVYGNIIISRNAKLFSLQGLANIDPTSVYHILNGPDIEVTDNPLLSVCNVASICGAIFDADKEVVLNGNAEGCNDINSLECSSLAFGGEVFYDENNNGIRDLGENSVQSIPILIEETGVSVFPRVDGTYFQIAEDGNSYTISIALDDVWEITTGPTSYNFVFEQGLGGYDNFDFGIRYKDAVYNANVHMASEFTRCNTDVDFVIVYEHLAGGYADSDLVFIDFELDPNCSFVSSSIPLENLDQNTGTIKLEDIQTFDKVMIDLVIEMPSEMLTGEIMSFRTEAYLLDQNDKVVLDASAYQSEVGCSYDPNDKQVNPIGVYDEHYTLFDETLTYMIRFQNTGNAEALTVEILDTLDLALEPRTFKVLGTSHDVITNISDRYVSFLFEDINLPDSTSNEPASHGFVLYEIEALEDLPDPTRIENTAHIYFDANPPIVTNTTKNTMVENIPTSVYEEEFVPFILRPNPASTGFGVDIENFRSLEMHDLSGRLILSSMQAEILVNDLEPQMYIVTVKTKDNIFVRKLLVVD